MSDLSRTDIIKLIDIAKEPLNLRGVNLTSIDLVLLNLKRADLWSADLRNADFLGLEMKLIISDDWNFLSYPRSHCLTGKDVFGKYIDIVYKYKTENVEGAKFLLNILSGAIGESNKTKVIVDEDDIEADDIKLDDMNLIPIKITHSRDKRYTF